ncbi:MAG: hypothetical protein WCZ28_09085, partial [Burkholderiaceae bacterium]
MQTELSTAQIPYIYSEFADLVGEKHWRKRVKKIKEEIKGFPFLAAHLADENEIAFQLDELRELQERYGFAGRWPEIGQQLYSAAELAVQVISMAKSLDADTRRRLIRRVHGALKNPDDMRGMRLELSVATHFLRRGQSIVWPEMEGEGTFDLLLPDMGKKGLEVECKSISGAKGYPINKREALTFFHHISRQLRPMVKSLRTGVGVVVTVSDRLPAMERDRIVLAADVARQIRAAQSIELPSGARIRLVEFDVSRLSGLPDGADVRSAFEETMGTRNRHTMTIGGGAGGGMIVVVVQSARDDAFLQATFELLGDAARRQLTGQRAGVLIAGLHGVAGDELLSVAGQDHNPCEPPTALALQVSGFLSSPSRSHLVGLGFLSRGAVRAEVDNIVDSGGVAYHFPC